METTGVSDSLSSGWNIARATMLGIVLAALCAPMSALAEGVTLTLRDVEMAEAVEMLSRAGKVNVLLSDGVDSRVTVNLYDADIEDAIHAIAHAGGYAVERLRGSYFIVDREEAGKHQNGGLTQLRTFKVQYSQTEVFESILEYHLSCYGAITTLTERRHLVIEDSP